MNSPSESRGPARKSVRLNPAIVRPPNPDPRNGKRDPAYIQALAKDIKKRGLRNPAHITMNDGDPTIVFGEHRRLALVLNGCKEAEFYLFEGEMTKADLAIEQFQESQLHQTFKPVEQATLLQQIMAEKGWTRAQLCEQMSIDESTISKLFRILENLDSSLHHDVDKGLLPFTCAYLIATVPEHAKQIELAERVKAGICTRTALGKRIKELLKKSPKARKPEPTTITCDDGLTVQLIGQKVEELLSALIALVERIKRAAKKEDALDILPVLLKRIA